MTHTEESNIEHILLEKSLYKFKKYEGIRAELEATLKRINDSYYSEHGLAHCDNILRNIDSLIPSNIKYKMGENELFCLLCSILLHDIGRIKQTRPYEPFRETNRDHARRSRDWTMEEGESLGLEIPYIKPVAWICWGHGDVEEAENEIRRDYNNCMVPIEKEEIDVLFLISLLRLGDVLDIGFRRIPRQAIDSLWKIPDSEIKFILKDYLTNAVIIKTKGWTIKITVRKPSNIDDGLFSEIETNLIKNTCEKVLNSVMVHLDRRDIYFRSIDVRTIKVEPEKIIERLLRREITERTYTEMAEEYENVSSWEPEDEGVSISVYGTPVEEIREPITEFDKVFDNKGEIIAISKPKPSRRES